MFNKKTITRILQILLVVLIIVFAFNWRDGYLDSYDGFPHAWYNCLEYIEQGTFFGGQPYCENGIVGPYTGYPIYKLVGVEHFQFSYLIFAFLINLLIFWFILKIVKKETGQNYAFLVAVLYFSLVYRPLMQRPDGLFAAFFFILGFYVLMHGRIRFKEIISGSLFFISIISKSSALFAVFPVFIFYFLSKVIEFKTEKGETGRHIKIKLSENNIFIYFKKKKFYDFIQLFAGFFATAVLVFLIFSNALYYIFLAFVNPRSLGEQFITNQTVMSTTQIMVAMIPKFSIYTWLYIQFYIIFIIALYYLFKKWNVYSVSILFFFTYFNYKVFKYQGFSTFNLGISSKYTAPVICLFIILAAILYKNYAINRKKRLIFASIIILLIAIPFAKEAAFDYLKKKVDMPTEVIPEQKYVLTPLGEFKKTNNGYEITKIMAATEIGWVRQLAYYNILNYSNLPPRDIVLNASYGELQQYLYEHDYFPYFREEIERGKYPLIMYGPPGWEHIMNLLDSMNQSTFKSHCVVRIPDLKYSVIMANHATILIFEKQSDCQQTVINMQTYYTKNFNNICRLSRSSWEKITKPVVNSNTPIIKEQCNSRWDLLEYYDNKVLSMPDIILLIFLIGLTIIYYKMIEPKIEKLHKK